MSLPLWPRYQSDIDDETSIDDAFVSGALDVRIEHISNDYYWIGITQADGTTTHVDIVLEKKRRMIRARIRR